MQQSEHGFILRVYNNFLKLKNMTQIKAVNELFQL